MRTLLQLKFKRFSVCLITSCFLTIGAYAQIGYQISLLNTATGEPRANETVNVTATITSSSGGVIWSGTQSVTSNDFGVLSLSVGNANTFKDLDLQEHKLPFFIEVSANGAMIGKSQILSVPVAEVARQVEPGIKLEDVVGTWTSQIGFSLSFGNDGNFHFDNHGYKPHITVSGSFIIDTNTIYLYPSSSANSSSTSTYGLMGLGICRLNNGVLYVEHHEMMDKYSR